MNKTYKEIAYSILESLYGHNIIDDYNISIDFIKAKINDVNIRLQEEVFKQHDSLEAFYQKQCCIEVVCEKTSCVIEGEMVSSGDVVWYSEIPSLNPKIGWKNISYLGKSDMLKGFKRVTFSGFMSGAQLDWTRGPIFTIVGNKIYFRDLPTTGTRMLCMVAILANPILACNFNEDQPYPTPDAYKLELLVKKDILSTFPAMPTDEIQDSRDNVGATQGKTGEVNSPKNG
jgi:hypothetical protein